MKLKLFVLLVGIIGCIILFQIAWLFYYIQIGKQVVKRSEKFEKKLENPEMRILIIGDSTAYGIGASSPINSLAGLYSQRFPEAEIVNMGLNGKKTIDLLNDLQSIQDQRFDLMQIDIGGNDIIRFRPYEETQTTIKQVLTLASQMADNVIFVSTGNLGTVKLFPSGTRYLLEKRTRKLREIFIAESNQFPNVHYVDLFREAEEDPFSKDPAKYYAEDFLHPSDAGYADWFSYITIELEKIGK
jgi:lysophospholipase L1-like esterase